MKEFCLLLFELLNAWACTKEGRSRNVFFTMDGVEVKVRTGTHGFYAYFSYQEILTIRDPLILVQHIETRLVELGGKP